MTHVSGYQMRINEETVLHAYDGILGRDRQLDNGERTIELTPVKNAIECVMDDNVRMVPGTGPTIYIRRERQYGTLQTSIAGSSFKAHSAADVELLGKMLEIATSWYEELVWY